MDKSLLKDPPAYLAALSKLEDENINLAEVAIMLAALQHEGIILERYFLHVDKIVTKVGARHSGLLSSGAADDVDTQMAALKQIVFEEYGYEGDSENYNNISNADLIDVIDSRKGLPVAIGILWLTAGLAQGWDVSGINFPGHFYCKISKAGEQRIVDPFQAFVPVQARDMRQKLKLLNGDNAELSANYYEPVSRRDVLIRLQNNIKMRQITMEDYQGALETVKRMQLIDPKEPRLFYDSGILQAKLGQPQAAIDSLQTYLGFSNLSAYDRQEANALIEQIRDLIN